MFKCFYCNCEVFNDSLLGDYIGCDQCGMVYSYRRIQPKDNVTEIRKSAAYLAKENAELQAQIRSLEYKLKGMTIHALEMQTVVAYVLRERLGGVLKMSLETHRLVQKSKDYEFGISPEQNGAVRSYETHSLKMIHIAGDLGNEPLIALPGKGKKGGKR